MNQNIETSISNTVGHWYSGILMIVMAGLLFSCTGNIEIYDNEKREPKIEPDYSDITIPPNIAPMNFLINEEAEKYSVHIYSLRGEGLVVKSKDKNIQIPSGKWAKLMEQCKGGDLFIDIYTKQIGSWKKFKTVVNHVAREPIDSYLVYRLFDQGFEAWNKMGIYQRCLENFNVSPVMINDISEGGCMNCHAFNKNNSSTMLFHMREKMPGTIIYKNGNITKVNTKTEQTITPGMFASWHPGGRYIAFSNNRNPVFFNSIHNKLRETVDTLSDLILYDSEKNIVYKYPKLASGDRFETFPSWSPDGKYLYFCSAVALPVSKLRDIRYDLLRVSFNSDTHQFGKIDTVVYSTSDELSSSFPRISPDGKFLLFCMSSYGNFSIWNSTSDLYIKNLETGEIFMPDINSKYAESYHTWSSNGRWIVFSSKRADGFSTLPYFVYFDSSGKTQKPFLLPQKDPAFYRTFLKSYNVPELVLSKINLNPNDFSGILASEPSKASFETLK
jgi:Tol biopolymer transport system component